MYKEVKQGAMQARRIFERSNGIGMKMRQMAYLLFGRGLVGIEGDVLEPVALVDILLVEQQRVRVDVLHLLELVLDEQVRMMALVEGQRILIVGRRGLFGERHPALKHGLFGFQVPRHGWVFAFLAAGNPRACSDQAGWLRSRGTLGALGALMSP
jgi:hypothetical protein